MCRQFDLSRSTVRETLRSLESEGKVRLVQRRGAFVCAAKHPGWMLQFAGGFSESEAAHENREIETKVISVVRGPLPAEACKALKILPGTTGVILQRSRWIDGRLALFAQNYLIEAVAGLIKEGKHLNGRASLNHCLRGGGWLEAGSRRSLSAAKATPSLAKRLEVPTGFPLMLVKSVMWTSDQVPFDYYTSWLNSDVVDVSIQVQVATGGGSNSGNR